MTVVHVPGKKSAHIMIYALSTCGWCKKTKKLLNDLGVEYHYEDVDLLQGEEKEKAAEVITHWNPSLSFPTIVIDNKKSIVGFKENEIKEAIRK